LKEVTLAVNPGESVSLVGKSGSGKTSLLMLASGIERPTQGEVYFEGKALSALDEAAMTRLRGGGIGIVFQHFHLLPALTALENVLLPLEFAGLAGAGERAEKILASVGLAHRLRHYPSQLSGGEQQRVALARAFALRPRLLLADEPTGNLDQANAAQVLALMFALREEQGTALLLVTHDPALAARCDRSVTLIDGRIAATDALHVA
jgi:putative ABC transport system ATP-binding protein